jgi:hypothetical protein
LGETTITFPNDDYNFEKAPLWHGLRKLIRQVEVAGRNKQGSREVPSLRIAILHFPRSFPADIMYLVLQNVAPILYQLWSRKKLSVDKPGNPNFAARPYHLDDASIG